MIGRAARVCECVAYVFAACLQNVRFRWCSWWVHVDHSGQTPTSRPEHPLSPLRRAGSSVCNGVRFRCSYTPTPRARREAVIWTEQQQRRALQQSDQPFGQVDGAKQRREPFPIDSGWPQSSAIKREPCVYEAKPNKRKYSMGHPEKFSELQVSKYGSISVGVCVFIRFFYRRLRSSFRFPPMRLEDLPARFLCLCVCVFFI